MTMTKLAEQVMKNEIKRIAENRSPVRHKRRIDIVAAIHWEDMRQARKVEEELNRGSGQMWHSRDTWEPGKPTNLAAKVMSNWAAVSYRRS